MLSWIPFRTTTVHETLIKYQAMFKFGSLVNRGMRENTYLITGMLLLIFLISWFSDEYIKVKLETKLVPNSIWLVAKYSIIIILTFVFLRPINQFIYFQF